MKFFSALSLLLLLSLSAAAQGSAFKIADLGWITGCWGAAGAGDAPAMTERWAPLDGDMMMGVAQTVKTGKTVEFEFLRLVQDGPNVFYIAKPSQNPGETPFKLIKLGPQEAIFENPEHDFPQRIIYRRNGDKLTARIEGLNEGKFLGIDFPKVRVKCE